MAREPTSSFVPPLLSGALIIALLVIPGPVAARPWQGISPGTSRSDEVLAKFGEPSTQGKLGGRRALVYKSDQAIAGTRQAQFFLRDDGIITEITVFPSAQLDREAVEGTYGKGMQKTFTEDFRPVWLYRASGVVVFFSKENTVEAITFKSGEAASPTANPPAAKSSRGAPAP